MPDTPSNNIYLFSGPCGCGKSSLANAYAKHLVEKRVRRQVYVLHGDDFHAGFVEAKRDDAPFVDDLAAHKLEWEDILPFNWHCLLTVAGFALDKHLDVVIDYVVEDELPLAEALARRYHAKLYYVVLTASREAIAARITQRGDTELIERALFLKSKLDAMPESQGHLLDNTFLPVEQVIAAMDMEQYQIQMR